MNQFGKATTMTEIPSVPHIAVIFFRTIHHEGDALERACPGDGIPGYDEAVCDYLSFKDKAAFDKWYKEVGCNCIMSYKVLQVQPVNLVVETRTVLKFPNEN